MNHPLCILDKANSDANKEVAELFIKFASTPEATQAMIESGIRPTNNPPLTFENSPFNLGNGVIVSNNQETIRVLPIPSPVLTQQIIDLWSVNKKEAQVIMVIDVSGSMGGSKITNAKSAAISFVNSMAGNDHLQVLVFSQQLTWLTAASGQVKNIRNAAVSVLNTLIASGGTALYDACAAANRRANELRQQDAAMGLRKNYALVVLSDGADTSSGQYNLASLLASLPDGSDSSQNKIHTIAYGDDADTNTLATISMRTNGISQKGSPSNIESIYTQISMEF